MRLMALLIAAATLAGCELEWRDVKPHADHRIAAWTQTDLGGGTWSDVSVDWEIENTGDKSAFVSMIVHAVTPDETYSAGVDLGRIPSGSVHTGTLSIATEGKQVSRVVVGRTMPNETEPW